MTSNLHRNFGKSLAFKFFFLVVIVVVVVDNSAADACYYYVVFSGMYYWFSRLKRARPLYIFFRKIHA